MKVSAAEWSRKAVAPLKSGFCAALFYGADGGLTGAARSAALKGVLGEAVRDPFRRADIAPEAARRDMALLPDECAAIAFGGGSRAIVMEGAGDSHVATIEAALKSIAPDAFLILTADALTPASKLRKLMEGAKTAACVALYPAEGAAIGETALDEARRLGLPRAEAEAGAAISDALAGASHGEILRFAELLALYKKGDAAPLSAADVAALAPGAVEAGADDVAMAVASGAAQNIPRLWSGFLAQGGQPSSGLRAVIQHLKRLRSAQAIAAAEGLAVEGALEKLRPPVFFKIKAAFAAQARGWSPAALEAALGVLGEVEAASRRGGEVPASAIIARAVLRAATMRR